MSKPIEEMSFEEIEAERRQIEAERAALAQERAGRQQGTAAGFAVPAAHDFIDTTGLPTTADLLKAEPEDAAPEDEAPKPEPWPHAHLVHAGLELEVRIPNQSALMAISMLQQLEGLGDLKLDIFNTFLANHLSPASLAKVIKELTRHDTAMSLQSLIQALVDLRIEKSKNS
jgi:hypothetical protein